MKNVEKILLSQRNSKCQQISKDLSKINEMDSQKEERENELKKKEGEEGGREKRKENIVKRVSWFKSSLLLRINNKHTCKY